MELTVIGSGSSRPLRPPHRETGCNGSQTGSQSDRVRRWRHSDKVSKPSYQSLSCGLAPSQNMERRR